MANTFDINTHPIQITHALALSHRFVFEFSLYSYTPRAIEDERQVFKVAAGQVGSWCAETLRAITGGDQDIAFHSRVYDESGAVFHVPMIDFKDFDPVSDGAALHQALASFGVHDYRLFKSGRSFHLYGLQLISHARWLEFLGRILLLNLPDQPEIVDVRWVGHRLMGGYGTLRWSKNNPHYKAMPALFSAVGLTGE